MDGATREELRELGRRSRRAQRWGFLGMLAMLLLVAAQGALHAWVREPWLSVALVGTGGAALLRYAYLAGEERGAFRKVFRRIAEDRRATRVVVQEGGRSKEQEARS